MPEQKFEYTLEVVDELPPESRAGGGGGRGSPLEDTLAQIKDETRYHTSQWDPPEKVRWILIGKYAKPTAATAAKNVLQQRHGRSRDVEGFEFRTRRLPEDRTMAGLFVAYDPNAVVQGAREKHEQYEKDRLAKLASAREKREAGNRAGLESAVRAGAEAAEKRAGVQKVAGAQKATAAAG